MAVFVSASDEGSGANHLCPFEITGWIAPELDWSQIFAPAWQERVLDGPPSIPYLHVTEIRSKAWRSKYGLSELEADRRLDEAAGIIGAVSSLYPVRVGVDQALFRKLYAPHKLTAASGGLKRYEPDYYTFVVYVYAVLCRVKVRHPDTEKVDFIVESKSGFTKYISEFYKSMPTALRHIAREDLVPLLGDFIPGSKDRVPLQAADFLCWHTQRAKANNLDTKDMRRWKSMARKPAFTFDVPEEILAKLAESFEKRKQGG
jgi:hypothetical protein